MYDPANYFKFRFVHLSRDEDPDPVGSVDFGPPDPDPTCDNGLKKKCFCFEQSIAQIKQIQA